MPLIKELEDLMLLLPEMSEYHQKKAAESLRRHIMLDDYSKGMTREQAVELILKDLAAVRARRDAPKGK